MNKTSVKTKKCGNDTAGKWRNGRRKKMNFKTKEGYILLKKGGIGG